MNAHLHTRKIKEMAANLGFDACGIAQAVYLEEDARRLEQYLKQQYHGEMSYMSNHFDLRVDPRKLVPGAQSVIVLVLNYFPEQVQTGDFKIARYAYGKDYHKVIKKKLKALLKVIQSEVGDVQGRGFVDSAPVLERTWAVRSGLGWIGKNGNLIIKGAGSYYFIATLIVDITLVPDVPFPTDHCGTCRLCMDACPTNAIVMDKVVDGSKCLSYATIEYKGSTLPNHFNGRLNEWAFGCDICQEVCPWNRFSTPHQTADLAPLPMVLHAVSDEWLQMDAAQFADVFGSSAIKRTGLAGMQRNILSIKNED